MPALLSSASGEVLSKGEVVSKKQTEDGIEAKEAPGDGTAGAAGRDDAESTKETKLSLWGVVFFIDDVDQLRKEPLVAKALQATRAARVPLRERRVVFKRSRMSDKLGFGYLQYSESAVGRKEKKLIIGSQELATGDWKCTARSEECVGFADSTSLDDVTRLVATMGYARSKAYWMDGMRYFNFVDDKSLQVLCYYASEKKPEPSYRVNEASAMIIQVDITCKERAAEKTQDVLIDFVSNTFDSIASETGLVFLKVKPSRY